MDIEAFGELEEEIDFKIGEGERILKRLRKIESLFRKIKMKLFGGILEMRTKYSKIKNRTEVLRDED